MFKRIFLVVAAFSLALALCVGAFAVKPDILDYRDGNTYLETFITSSENDTVYSEFVELVTVQTSIIVYDPDCGKIYLVDIGSADNVTVGVNSAGLCYIFADTDGDGFGGQGWDIDGESIVYSSKHFWTPGTTLSNVILLGGLGLDDIEILYADGMDNTYIADIDGRLIVVDDRGDSSDSKTDSSDEDDEGGGILGFLGDFWDKLKGILVSLFIPSDGFLESWFNDLKAAFTSKLEAVTGFYNSITGFFDKITYPDVMSEYFPAELWGDFISSWLRSVITGLIMVLTFITCYRKIVALLSE